MGWDWGSVPDWPDGPWAERFRARGRWNEAREGGQTHPSRAKAGVEPLRPSLDSDLSLPTCSYDQRFFVKTQRRQEVQVLLAHLPRYVQHLQKHPHSLLARLLGKAAGEQVLNCKVPREGGSWGGAQRNRVGIGSSLTLFQAGQGLHLGEVCSAHRLIRESGGGTWSGRLRYAVGLEKDLEQGTPVIWIRDCGVRGTFSSFRSIQSAGGSREKGECSGGEVAQQRGLLEGELGLPSLPTPVPRSTSSSCSVSSTLPAASLRGESIERIQVSNFTGKVLRQRCLSTRPPNRPRKN